MFENSIKNNLRKLCCLSILFFVFTCVGCATSMNVTPLITEIDCHSFKLKGIVRYDKNIKYLPRTITNESKQNDVSSLIIKYEYQVSYGRDYLFHSGEFVPLFNPLTLIGSPIGGDNVYVIGKLDIMQGGKNIKIYKSACVLEKTRNLFYQGETFSEMRKKGLISVRNNIESQMCQDKDYLINICSREKSN